MGENDLGGHAAKDEGEGDAEEDEMIVGEEVRMWRGEPGDARDAKGNDWGPFEEDRGDRKLGGAAGADDVNDTRIRLESVPPREKLRWERECW
jgi:hypothetical protein